MRMPFLGRAALVAVLSSGLVVTSGHVAMAAPEPTDQVRATIDEALASVGQELTPQEEASIPAGISVAGDAGTLEFGEYSVGVTPADAENSRVIARADGVQALTVLNEGSGTAEFTLSTPDGATITPRDGGLDVTVEADGAVISVAQVAAPWAVDANGHTLPTEYTFADGTITQTVDTTGATFPVVADPLITFGLMNAPYGPGPYLNLTGANLKVMTTGIIAAATMAPAVVCLTLDKIPNPARGVVRAACGLFGVATIGQVLDDLAKVVKGYTWNNNTCYQTLLGRSHPFIATSMSNCQ